MFNVILTQNRKIAVTAVALFLMSLSIVLLFFEQAQDGIHHGSADVLGLNGHQEEVVDTIHSVDPEKEEAYREGMGEDDSPFSVVNLDSEIVFVSENACNGEVERCQKYVGSKLLNFINSADVPDMAVYLTKIATGKTPIMGIGPFRVMKKNIEGEFLYLYNAYPVLNDDGEVEEVIFSYKDITEKAGGLSAPNEGKKEESINNNYPNLDKDKEILPDTRKFVDKISFARVETEEK